MRYIVGLVALLVLGCTKENPHACGDGTCNDPQLPFCDTQGTLGGAMNECVAVTCTPGAFAECRGDTSVVCDGTGANYELQPCARGCDDATGGCHIEPSNDLGQYLDMVPDPPDLDIATGTINTSTGEINGSTTVPSFLVPAPEAGSMIRVFVAGRVHIVDAKVITNGLTKPALAILATEDIRVENSLSLVYAAGTKVPGEIEIAGCSGAHAVSGAAYNTTNGQIVKTFIPGSGGGAHATAGGDGGSVVFSNPANNYAGGAGGLPSGTESLVPLRGGCPSIATGGSVYGGHGGGAVQLTSATRIKILGTINVAGERGGMNVVADPAVSEIIGGGAGGGVLLEAPTVELDSKARILANGAGGASRESVGTMSESGPSAGGPCTVAACGEGGAGAGVGVAATAGAAALYDSSQTFVTGGGGGGGLGRLRINTSDGGYVRSATTLELAAVSTSVINRH